jgi:hypothetical protein
MDLDKLFSIMEKLRIQTIGDPVWIPEKSVFEYTNQSIETVAVLKTIRAAQSIKSLYLLCNNGLFIDMGTIYRCIHDCSAEIYFLLEQYPQTSDNVRKFVKAFFETTITADLNTKTEQVTTKKIHSAMVRVLTGSKQDEQACAIIRNIYKRFSGYTHTNYSHIMQIYGGSYYDFNLHGVPSIQQQEMHMQLVKEAYFSVLCSIGFIAGKFKLTGLFSEIVKLLK